MPTARPDKADTKVVAYIHRVAILWMPHCFISICIWSGKNRSCTM